jgi:hypothetical protein
MRSPWAVVAAGIVACLLLTGCEGAGPPTVSPEQIGLQQGDLPAGLARCPQSGDVSAYLRTPKPNQQPAHDELLSAWLVLQKEGAVHAAVTIYAAESAACTARVGTGNGANVTSLVVEFHDDGRAAAAFGRGVLGFTTPSEDAEIPDMDRGAATGVGRNAWILQRSVDNRSLVVGLWERDSVLVLFVAVDADPLNAKKALSEVDGRIP